MTYPNLHLKLTLPSRTFQHLCAANLAGAEVEEDDIATSCGQTCRLKFSQVLQSDHHTTAILREETLSC